MSTGAVYAIISPSKKRYIGSATNFERRRADHLRQLRKGEHHSRPLQRAWDKYGSLEFSPILICRREDLFFYEQLLIDQFHPEYNVSPCACGTRGLRWSPESIKAVTEIRRRQGAALTDDQRKKLAILAGEKFRNPQAIEKLEAIRATQEYRDGCARRAANRKQTDQERAKRSQSIKESWADKNVRESRLEGMAKNRIPAGWKHTEEAKSKMRGRIVSKTTCDIMRERRLGSVGHWRGKSRPQSTRDKISMTLKGRSRSAESIAKQKATTRRKKIHSIDHEVI